MPSRRAVLVTGANGYIGNAVCRAFVRAGWIVYGLARRREALGSLAAEEIIPLLGSPGDRSFLPSLLEKQSTFDAIVSTTEDVINYESHFHEIMALVQALADSSNKAGVRPIVLFTSGCKDYGMAGLADDPNVGPQTESSSLDPPESLRPRAFNAIKIFERKDSYDGVVLRPTTLYGLSSSYYGTFFTLASRAKENGEPLIFPAHQKSMLHGTHIDDCAEAYVAIAECEDRTKVAGQAYNISGWRYETLEEIGEALVKEYGLEKGVKYEPTKVDKLAQYDLVFVLTGFSQWVGSQKLRSDVGWKDRRMLFSENLGAYRIAYEEAVKQGHSNVRRVQRLVTLAKVYRLALQIALPFKTAHLYLLGLLNKRKS
ncbi:NAD dependent epimerase/dehydratase [Fonsecaea pedrosoi]|nr:NAD dependent epimerase/dehydratase [Fonsecaea pedrosoi]